MPKTPASTTPKLKLENGGKFQLRARNFDKDETEIIMREAGKVCSTLKGRFNPMVTNEIKQKTWEKITNQVNLLNGVGDRTWTNIRKKWQDIISSARKKTRDNLKDRRQTGGGPSVAEALTPVERIALESVAPVTVSGIDGGVDSNNLDYSAHYTVSIGNIEDVAGPSSAVSVSAILEESSQILQQQAADSEEEDSQISVHLARNSSSPTPKTHHDGDQPFLPPISPIQSYSELSLTDDDQDRGLFLQTQAAAPPLVPFAGLLRPSPMKRFKTPWQQQSARPAFHPRLFRAQLHQPPHQPSLTQHRAPATRHPEPRPPRHAVGAPPPAPIVSANISGLQSNRTVTRDIRKDEFKQIMKQQELTNKYLQQLVELKEELVKLTRRKYELEYGFNIMGEPNE